jgi:hypothetical protein
MDSVLSVRRFMGRHFQNIIANLDGRIFNEGVVIANGLTNMDIKTSTLRKVRGMHQHKVTAAVEL